MIPEKNWVYFGGTFDILGQELKPTRNCEYWLPHGQLCKQEWLERTWESQKFLCVFVCFFFFVYLVVGLSENVNSGWCLQSHSGTVSNVKSSCHDVREVMLEIRFKYILQKSGWYILQNETWAPRGVVWVFSHRSQDSSQKHSSVDNNTTRDE